MNQDIWVGSQIEVVGKLIDVVGDGKCYCMVEVNWQVVFVDFCLCNGELWVLVDLKYFCI